MTPTCTLTVNPDHGNIPLTTTINGTKPSRATYINLTFGDGQSQSNPSFSLQHQYTTV
jgi:PKD repeat protein